MPNWKKVIVSGSDASLNSLNVATNVVAQSFTGSLFGTASYSSDTNLLDGKDSSEFAITGSNIFKGNQTISGSVIASGSHQFIGSTLITGSFTLSGSHDINNPTIKIQGDVELDGAIKFIPVSDNINSSLTGSYIFVSGSTNDLYFTQNSNGYANTTRLRWLEGNLYTGLLNGGLITVVTGSTTFNVSSGSGLIVNLNASLTDNPYPTIQYINWGNFTSQSLTFLTSSIQTYLGINSSGQITQQTIPFTDGEFNTKILLGTVLHQNQATVNGSITYPNVAYGWKQRSYDFIKAFGPLKLSGLPILPSSSLGLTVGSGTAWADGRNYQVDPNNPSYIIDSGTNISKIFRYYQSGSSFVQDTNGGIGYTVIDPANYNPNGSGSIQPVPGTGANREWTIQRVFWYPNSATKGIVVYYGTKAYPTSTDAIANIPYEQFFETANTQQNAVYLGAIAIRNNGVFTDSTSYNILPGGIFRSIGGSGGGGTAPAARFVDLADVSVTGPTNYQAVVYNATNLKWINSSFISASIYGNAATATSASYASTASYVTPLSQSVTITGSLGVGTTGSAVVGRIDAANDVVAFATSDENLKKNIKPIKNAIEKVEQIGGYTFDWKKDKKNIHGFSGHDVGVIAQEIEAVLPEVVTTRENGYKAVRYEKIIPLLIEAIKEQQNKINELENLLKQIK